MRCKLTILTRVHI